MDRTCYEVLTRMCLSEVNLISLEDFEKGDQELLKVKETRSFIEYYFTCTPSLLLFVFKKHPAIDMITYLDADLFLFNSPKPIYEEIAGHSIAITEHRFPQIIRFREQYGIYNVGLVYFKRDENSRACLHWWRERCIEWCYDRLENGRFADQKYLDQWPYRFESVTVLQNKGVNLAPWNIENYSVSDDRNGVLVDGEPLIFFHFHGFRQMNQWMYDTNLTEYKVKLSEVMKQSIYGPYIDVLLNVRKQISPFFLKNSIGNNIRYPSENTPILKRFWKWLYMLLFFCKTMVSRNFIFFIKGRII